MTENINEINAYLKRAETSIKAAKDMIEKEYYKRSTEWHLVKIFLL